MSKCSGVVRKFLIAVVDPFGIDRFLEGLHFEERIPNLAYLSLSVALAVFQSTLEPAKVFRLVVGEDPPCHRFHDGVAFVSHLVQILSGKIHIELFLVAVLPAIWDQDNLTIFREPHGCSFRCSRIPAPD